MRIGEFARISPEPRLSFDISIVLIASSSSAKRQQIDLVARRRGIKNVAVTAPAGEGFFNTIGQNRGLTLP